VGKLAELRRPAKEATRDGPGFALVRTPARRFVPAFRQVVLKTHSSLRSEAPPARALAISGVATRRAGIFVQPAFLAHSILKNDRQRRQLPRQIGTLLQTRIMQVRHIFPDHVVVHLADLRRLRSRRASGRRQLVQVVSRNSPAVCGEEFRTERHVLNIFFESFGFIPPRVYSLKYRYLSARRVGFSCWGCFPY